MSTVRFLDTPVSQAELYGDTVNDCAQQLFAVQKQTEAIQHILPQRDAPFVTALPRTSPQSCSLPWVPIILQNSVFHTLLFQSSPVGGIASQIAVHPVNVTPEQVNNMMG